MKKFRLSFALLLLALVLAVVPAVFAQDDTLGASAGDFNLWTSSLADSVGADSMAFDFTATLDVAGIQDTTVHANLTGSGALDKSGDSPVLQLDVTGTVESGSDSQDVNLSLRIVDGMVYLNSGDGWKGGSLAEVAGGLSSAFGQGLASGAGIPDPSSLASGDLSALTSNPAMASAMAALSSLKPSDFLSLSRTDASGAADFTLDLDLAKLLASPALAPMFAGALGGASAGTGDAAPMTDAQIAQMGQMMGMMFGQATITFDSHVDLESKLVNELALNVNLPLDQIMGPGALVSVTFDINLSNYNEPVNVEVPADVQMMTEPAASSN